MTTAEAVPCPLLNDREVRAIVERLDPDAAFGCLETAKGRLPLKAMARHP